MSFDGKRSGSTIFCVTQSSQNDAFHLTSSLGEDAGDFDFSDVHSSCLALNPTPNRRTSFLYRPDSSGDASSYSSRRPSVSCGDAVNFHTDEPIVTPFAQILASLRKVRANFICLTNVHSSKDSRFGTSHAEEPRRIPCPDDPPNSLAVETLEELEWCLERLESIQTHRSVSDMASSKPTHLSSAYLFAYPPTSLPCSLLYMMSVRA
uniref:3',5'-cyclic-AMP phosphodiesterase n=1 Tax=Echinococcus granulosus TaxID=6210 RepID=A0A068WN92_ECHGR|nr:cAMP specific 3'5' cyclic phosphodiesterase [Echinococcus granulosus]